MNKFSLKLALLINNFLNNQYSTNELRYAIELLLSQCILLFFMFTVSIVTNSTLQFIGFIIPLFFLRSFSGGYHSQSFFECLIITNTICFGSIFLSNTITNHYFYLLTTLISSAILVKYSPITSRNLSTKQISKNRRLSLFFTLVFTLCILFKINFSILNYKILCFILLSVAVSLLISKYKE